MDEACNAALLDAKNQEDVQGRMHSLQLHRGPGIRASASSWFEFTGREVRNCKSVR